MFILIMSNVLFCWVYPTYEINYVKWPRENMMRMSKLQVQLSDPEMMGNRVIPLSGLSLDPVSIQLQAGPATSEYANRTPPLAMSSCISHHALLIEPEDDLPKVRPVPRKAVPAGSDDEPESVASWSFRKYSTSATDPPVLSDMSTWCGHWAHGCVRRLSCRYRVW